MIRSYCHHYIHQILFTFLFRSVFLFSHLFWLFLLIALSFSCLQLFSVLLEKFFNIFFFIESSENLPSFFLFPFFHHLSRSIGAKKEDEKNLNNSKKGSSTQNESVPDGNICFSEDGLHKDDKDNPNNFAKTEEKSQHPPHLFRCYLPQIYRSYSCVETNTNALNKSSNYERRKLIDVDKNSSQAVDPREYVHPQHPPAIASDHFNRNQHPKDCSHWHDADQNGKGCEGVNSDIVLSHDGLDRY